MRKSEEKSKPTQAAVYNLSEPREDYERDSKRMVIEIDEIVSGDWGFSVTDDMVNSSNSSGYGEFTQEQAREMSRAIGKVYSIAHAIHCYACGGKYRLVTATSTDSMPSQAHSRTLHFPNTIGGLTDE